MRLSPPVFVTSHSLRENSTGILIEAARGQAPRLLISRSAVAFATTARDRRSKPSPCHGHVCRRTRTSYQLTVKLAERVGFEPTIPLRVCRISSAVTSTTRPPLQPTAMARVGAHRCRSPPGSSASGCWPFRLACSRRCRRAVQAPRNGSSIAFTGKDSRKTVMTQGLVSAIRVGCHRERNRHARRHAEIPDPESLDRRDAG